MEKTQSTTPSNSLAIPTVFITAALSIVGALIVNTTADTKAAIKDVSIEVRTLRNDLYALKLHIAAQTGVKPATAAPWELSTKTQDADIYSHK